MIDAPHQYGHAWAATRRRKRRSLALVGLAGVLALLGAWQLNRWWLLPVQVIATCSELRPDTQIEAIWGPAPDQRSTLRAWPLPSDADLQKLAQARPGEEIGDFEKTIPGRAKYIGRLPTSLAHLEFRCLAGQARCERVTIIWGDERLFDRRWDQSLGSAALDCGFPGLPAWRVPALVARNAALLVGRTFLFALAGLLVGVPCLCACFGRLACIERYVAAVLTGWGLLIATGFTLTHCGVSGTSAFWSVLAVAAALNLVLLSIARWRGALRVALVPEPAQRRTLAALSAAGCVSTLVLFYPALSRPAWFLGQAYTDTYYYINVSERFRAHAFDLHGQLDGQDARANCPAGCVVLSTDRAGELIALLDTALLCASDARSVYAQLHFNFWLVLPFVVYVLFRRWQVSRAGVWLGVLLTCGSAEWYALFTQDYLAQFLCTMFLLYSVYATTVLVQEITPATRPAARLALRFFLAAVLAGGIAVYPEQALFPVVLALYFGGAALLRRTWRPVAELAMVGGMTALVSGLGVLPVLAGFANRPAHFQKLNDIAQNVVFPFHDHLPRLLAVCFGLTDWVDITPLLPAVLSEILGRAGTDAVRHVHSLRDLQFLTLLLCLGLAALGLVTALRSPRRRILAITLLCFGAAAATFGFAHQTYLYCKFMMTLGPLLLLAVVLGLEALLATRRTALIVAAALAAGLVLLFNLRSAWTDNSIWLLTSHHPVLDAARTHINVLDEDLLELAATLNGMQVTPADRVAVVIGDLVRGRGSDADRVLDGHVNCCFREFRVLRNPSPDAWAQARPRLALVYAGFSLPPELARGVARLMDNATFALYRILAPGALARPLVAPAAR